MNYIGMILPHSLLTTRKSRSWGAGEDSLWPRCMGWAPKACMRQHGWSLGPLEVRAFSAGIISKLIHTFPRNRGMILEGSHNKDYSILGSLYLGKLPHTSIETSDASGRWQGFIGFSERVLHNPVARASRP